MFEWDETWSHYPENRPEISGYYMTKYYNPQHDADLFKTLWYDTEEGIWQGPWRWSYDLEPVVGTGRLYSKVKHKGLDVDRYQPASRADYYTQCEFVEK